MIDRREHDRFHAIFRATRINEIIVGGNLSFIPSVYTPCNFDITVVQRWRASAYYDGEEIQAIVEFQINTRLNESLESHREFNSTCTLMGNEATWHFV